METDFKIGALQLTNFTKLNPKDAEMVLGWRNHKNVKKWMFRSSSIPLKEHLDFINILKNSTTNLYFLVRSKSHDLGVIYITDIDYSHKKCEWGYYANPTLINGGAGMLLAYLVMEIVFEILHFQSLSCALFPENKNSFEINQFFGFREDGLENKLINNGTKKTSRNVLAMSLRRSEWQRKKTNIKKYVRL